MALENFLIFPALVMGGIIGLVEMFFVHADEIGMGWFKHGLHALPFTILFVFLSMNVDFALSYVPLPISGMLAALVVRAVVTVVGMLKIAGAAAIAGKVGVKPIHTLIIGALIFAAPYVWTIVGGFIPIPF